MTNSIQTEELGRSVFKHGKWSTDEDAALRKAVELFGEKQWRKVTLLVPSRTPVQCLHRWCKILKPGLVKGPWKKGEDALLREWVKLMGPGKWAECALTIPGRTGKQCRERWTNAISPDIKKGNWSEEENKLIFELHEKIGPKWTDMAKVLPGRTENSIKNRYYSFARKHKYVCQDTDFFLNLTPCSSSST